MNKFSQQIAEKEKRKLKALRENKPSVWFGLGMFGMVGWSVTVPALLGAALGTWLDKRYPETFSWTLTLLVAGLFSGCAIAWNWITKENKETHQNKKETNE
jgi:ATP synthase protein I